MYGFATSWCSLTSFKNEPNPSTTSSVATASGSTFVVIIPSKLLAFRDHHGYHYYFEPCWISFLVTTTAIIIILSRAGFRFSWPSQLSLSSWAVLDFVFHYHHGYHYHLEPCWISFFVTITAIIIILSRAGSRFSLQPRLSLSSWAVLGFVFHDHYD